MAIRNGSSPSASMSANVRLSSPGAPPFRFACWYASARVSTFATWTKSPQNRCVFSDFALSYIRRRRSCKLLSAFIISLLPPFTERNADRFGSFPPRAFCCTRMLSTTTRSAIRGPSQPFPTHGYRPGLCGELSSPDPTDFSSCSLPLRSMSPLIPRR